MITEQTSHRINGPSLTTIQRLVQDKSSRPKTTDDRLHKTFDATLMTDFSGSMAFVYLQAIWFGLWIILNLGLIKIPHLTAFDPYPFGLLTLMVSLEAIFLSTFVL